jgi:diaminopimelate decarboxylase
LNPAVADAVRQAAGRWGTPAYLYDLPQLRGDAAALTAAFPDPWLRLYSLKANALPGLIREVAGLGFGASAVSGGELTLAARAGFPPARTALEGIGKTPRDLARVVSAARAGRPLLWVSLESAEEAAELAGRIGRALGAGVRGAGDHRRSRGKARVRVDALIRINPAVRPETLRGLAVGASESKFGVLPEDLPAVIAAGGGPDGPIRWRGIHVHVGSQLGAVDAFRSAVTIGAALLGLQRAVLPDFDTLDVGSGFPVGEDTASVPTPEHFAVAAREALDELGPEARPARVAVEPGRAIVARAGRLLARVLHVREREPRLVVLDAGMTELIRPALYGAEHPIEALTSLGRPFTPSPSADLQPASVHGPVCESTDRFGESALPPLQRGDLVAIGLAGAYASSMSMTYNGRPRPPEVAWDGERLRLLRRRGTVPG